MRCAWGLLPRSSRSATTTASTSSRNGRRNRSGPRSKRRCARAPSRPSPWRTTEPPALGERAGTMTTTWLSAAHWVAVLRIGLGLWWLESFRHKDKAAWFERQSGIKWAASVAEKHRWPAVRQGFDRVVAPRPQLMSYLIVLGELAIGLGLVLGFLTPLAALASMLLNLSYFVLMIHDWAE